MQLGIFAKTFVRSTLEEVFEAVRAHGIGCVQFNFACAGVASMPQRIESGLCERIRHTAEARGIVIAAVSGTFNMIHPDVALRRDGMTRLRELAMHCGQLGTSTITLCTGTRDGRDMWRRHADNDDPEAWRDLLMAMREAVEIAEDHGVTLAIEPEIANVIDSAPKARRLLDEIASSRLKIVMDAANLFHAGELPRMREIMDEAIELLGEEVVLAHAKDLSIDGEAGHVAAGQGVLDYHHYLSLLQTSGFDGPLVLHGLAESQVAQSLSFLRSKLSAARLGTTA